MSTAARAEHPPWKFLDLDHPNILAQTLCLWIRQSRRTSRVKIWSHSGRFLRPFPNPLSVLTSGPPLPVYPFLPHAVDLTGPHLWFQVDEFMGNGDRAAVAYSRATILLSFILTEAPTLHLNPPFSLSASDQQRIFTYIAALETHLNRSRGLHLPPAEEADHA